MYALHININSTKGNKIKGSDVFELPDDVQAEPESTLEDFLNVLDKLGYENPLNRKN